MKDMYDLIVTGGGLAKADRKRRNFVKLTFAVLLRCLTVFYCISIDFYKDKVYNKVGINLETA